jgi:hypothetical protein
MKRMAVVPIQRDLCLLQVSADTITLADALEPFCFANTEFPSRYHLILHSRRLFESNLRLDDTTHKNSNECKREVCRLLEDIVPATIFKRALLHNCLSQEQYYGRIRSYATQYGLISGVLFLLDGPNELRPENILFSCRDDSVLISGYFNFLNCGRQIEHPSDQVILRFSRNLCTAMSPVLMMGTMVSSIGCLLNVVSENQSYLDVGYL